MQEHVKKLYDERVQLLHDAARGKKTSRVPLLSVASGWALADGGYPYSETLRNWDMMCKAVVEYEKRYHFDFIFHPGTRNPIRIGEAFGSNNYLVDDESYSITVLDSCLMEESEYDEITRERVKYLWEKFLPRKTGNATKEQLIQSIIEFTKLSQFTKTINHELKEECGVVQFSRNSLSHPLEVLFHGLRGMRGYSMDLRRHPDDVKQYCDSVMTKEQAVALVKSGMEQKNTEAAFDFHMPMLAQTLMNKKTIDQLYWPLQKAIIDAVVESDGTICLFMEGDNTRLWDYFKDIPKGHVTLWLEQDNLFEAKKVLGNNITLAGGYPLSLLTSGSKEACVDFAKKCVDELAVDGGWIFAIDKGLHFKRDAKRENVEAVMQYMQELKL